MTKARSSQPSAVRVAREAEVAPAPAMMGASDGHSPYRIASQVIGIVTICGVVWIESDGQNATRLWPRPSRFER